LFCSNGGDEFLIGTQKTQDASKQFITARSLGEHLWNGPAENRSLLTMTQRFRQQRSRAFAAELLAPSASLRKLISGSVIASDEVEDLAADFGVSTLVVSHQIRNHNLATIR
jgi:Zn-dependent peptidase ImmA (M78 family)